MPIQSLLIQLMSEEIDEPVDAIIRFSLVSSSKSRNKLGSQEYISGIWDRHVVVINMLMNISF